MATVDKKTASSGGSSGGRAKVLWDELVPEHVPEAGIMSPEGVKEVWEKLYELINVASADEHTKLSVRCGVYVYGVLNATSRSGDYAGEVVCSTGIRFAAAHIVAAAGTFSVRQFYRGNMDEAYEFLKESGAMEEYPRFIAKCAKLGVRAECAFATADYLENCHRFTPAEERAYDAARAFSLERARRARGGQTLEEVEGGVRHERLAVQGPRDEAKEGGTIVW